MEKESMGSKNLLDFSKHYGFTPKTLPSYRPQTKGKVERFGGYLKHSFTIP
ncbi:MAG: DDE-type integrase/transposase/recombinase [Chlamydiales bacterium]|nr:DDE-type integrase/transposase/recombinase [Chlamydiales bacterium]